MKAKDGREKQMWAVQLGQFAGRLTAASAMVSQHVLEGALPVTAAAALPPLVHFDGSTGPCSSSATRPRPASLISPRYLCAVCLFVLSVLLFVPCVFERMILLDHDHALT